MDTHIDFINKAMKHSAAAVQSAKGLPVGCVIVRNGEVIAEGHNEVFLQMNPTAHAEMVVIAKACKKMESLNLEGCVLYTTVEPCPMCMSAAYWANVSEIYYAVSSEEAAKVGFDDSFIFEELKKPAKERKIPLRRIPVAEASEVLKDWQKKDAYSAQHWSGK